MGIYILVIGLCVMLVMAYLLDGCDILSPFVLTVGMFLISALTALMNIQTWKFHLSEMTVFLILTMVFVFGIGAVLARNYCESNIKPVVNDSEKTREFSLIITFGIIMLLCLFLAYTVIDMYRLSVEGGNQEGIRGMLSYARSMTLEEDFSRGRLSNHILVFSKAAGLIFLWKIISHITEGTWRKRYIIYTIPVVLVLAIQSIGTVSRGFFIEWISYVLMLSLILIMKKNHWKKFNPIKICLLGIGAIFLFFIIFIILGLLSDRFGSKTIVETLSFYTGMSIPSFDSFLRMELNKLHEFGNETLYGVYAILSRLGFDVPVTTRHLEFVDFNGTSGNIYTSLRRYIHDYGIVVTYIIQFYLGILYSFLYNFIKKRPNQILIITYAVMAYPLVMQGIDEILLSQYVALNTINMIIYMLIIYCALAFLKKPYISVAYWTEKLADMQRRIGNEKRQSD